MAVYTDSHVAIRPPKSGVSWLRNFLVGQLGADEIRGVQHSPLSYLRERHPEVFVGRTTFSTVRNAWDWYGSFFYHLVRTGRAPIDGFKPWLRIATHAVDHVPDRPPPSISIDWESRGVGQRGLYSAVYEMIPGAGAGRPREVDVYVATDRIIEGVEMLFGVVVDAAYRKPWGDRATIGPLPVSAVPYSDLYDPEMTHWVANADAALIDRFGFRPFSRSSQALYRV